MYDNLRYISDRAFRPRDLCFVRRSSSVDRLQLGFSTTRVNFRVNKISEPCQLMHLTNSDEIHGFRLIQKAAFRSPDPCNERESAILRARLSKDLY